MNKEDIILLIEKWSAFCENDNDNSLQSFANFLLSKQQENLKLIDKSRQISYLLSRIDRYSKARVKILFHDLPLINYADFLLLNTVYHNPNIPKKELYESNIYEMNSGTQVVNRLKREALLIDRPSKMDKRVSLLQITALGKDIRNVAFERLGSVVNSKFSVLTEKELNQLLFITKKLEKRQEILSSTIP